MQNEHVLVVPAKLLREAGYFQGFCRQVERYLKTLLQPEVMSYRPRRLMENDPSFKQLIPYVIFCYRGEQSGDQLFSYTRGQGQGEQRLHAKRSIGVGGHISAEDARRVGNHNVYLEGLRRELDEEVIIQTPYQLRCVGLINDDITDVGRVHLGIVYLGEVERPELYAREAEMHEPAFRPVAQLMQELEQFESWSQICLEALYGTTPSTLASPAGSGSSCPPL